MRFEYCVIRSKRKSVTVSVSAENVITVRCPLSMSDNAVEEFIDLKSDWLIKIIAANNIRQKDNASIIDYKEIYVGGRKLPLIFSDINKVENERFYVKDLAAVKKTLIRYYSNGLVDFAKRIAKQSGFKIPEIDVKAYRSRWGCCDRSGAITLNCLLIMLPLYLQKYVIVHELCHTVYFNHSQTFWKLVEKIEPNYRVCRNNLKDFNFLTKIY